MINKTLYSVFQDININHANYKSHQNIIKKISVRKRVYRFEKDCLPYYSSLSDIIVSIMFYVSINDKKKNFENFWYLSSVITFCRILIKNHLRKMFECSIGISKLRNKPKWIRAIMTPEWTITSKKYNCVIFALLRDKQCLHMTMLLPKEI